MLYWPHAPIPLCYWSIWEVAYEVSQFVIIVQSHVTSNNCMTQFWSQFLLHKCSRNWFVFVFAKWARTSFSTRLTILLISRGFLQLFPRHGRLLVVLRETGIAWQDSKSLLVFKDRAVGISNLSPIGNLSPSPASSHPRMSQSLHCRSKPYQWFTFSSHSLCYMGFKPVRITWIRMLCRYNIAVITIY